MWYIHAMEYYSALTKKKGVLPYARAQMNLEDIMLSEDIILSEINQSQKDKPCMIPLI